MINYKAIIIADGIPTIFESIKFLNEKGIKEKYLCISLNLQKIIN